MKKLAERLLDLAGRDGLWGAFRLTPGESRLWVSALVARVLTEAAASGHLPAAMALRCRIAAEHAADILVAHLTPEGGIGYGGGASADSDSTAALVRLLVALRRPVPPAIIAFLQAHGTPEAGFGTYRANGSDDLWAQPTPDVDAAVACALHLAGALGIDDLVLIWQRLAPLQREDGTWDSFWWPEGGVSTSCALELWRFAGQPDPAPREISAQLGGFHGFHLVLADHARGDVASAVLRLGTLLTHAEDDSAKAVLLAPRRYESAGPDEASPEGRGVMTTLAALACLTRLPVQPPKPTPHRTDETLSRAMADLARDCGLGETAALKVRRVTHHLLADLIAPDLPWPNRAVSNLSQGWPVEFSARLGADDQPDFRFACDLGDVRLSPEGRISSARRSLADAAASLDLTRQWQRIDAALDHVATAAMGAATDERFFLWGGLDLAEAGGAARAVLKTYANLALVSDKAARLDFACDLLRTAGFDAKGGRALKDLARQMGEVPFAQQIGFAAVEGGKIAAKVYFELPAYSETASRVAARVLGLPETLLSPEIKGLASLGDAGRVASGLAFRIDPEKGLMPEVTLATQASSQVIWRPTYEIACIEAFSGELGLQPQGLRALHQALLCDGPARRTLHTLTLSPKGVSAAIYLRGDGFLSRHLAPRSVQRPPRPDPVSPTLRPQGDCHVPF